jgi:multidrug resistance efflux pump
MLIVIGLYAGLLWLIFFRLKLLPLNWTFGGMAALIGCSILLVFMGLLSYLTPSGRIEVMGKVAEITPNVSGQVTEVPVQRNVNVKAGTILFQIDRTPYEHRVRQLKAALAEARQKAEQLKANVNVAVADVQALRVQFDRAEKRREDIEQLGQRQAASQFTVQDAVTQSNTLGAQLAAAQAREESARLAATSEIDGENTAAAQLQAQLDNALWELDQTTVRAPADGYVSASTLTVGQRVTPFKSAMAFIVVSEIEILGIFPQNGFQTIRPGTTVRLVFSHNPGHVYEALIVDVLRAVGEGQFAASGTLSRVNAVGLTAEYPALISTPKGYDTSNLRLGMSGTATAFSDKAGPIGLIASVLLSIKAYAMYL